MPGSAGLGRGAGRGDSPGAAGPQRPNNARGAGPGPLPGTKRSAGREQGAASGGGGAGPSRPAAAPPPCTGPDPGGDKGPETPAPSPSSPGRSRCPSVRSLHPSVCRSLSPSVSLLVPLPLSSVPQTRSPVSLSVPLSPCLPVPHLYILSLSPTSVPWTLSLFSGSLCPSSSSVFPLLCPSVFLPSLSACLAVTLVSLSLFLCPIPCLPVPYLSVIPVSLAPLCHLSISFLRLSSSLCPTVSCPLSLCLPSLHLQPPSWDPHLHPTFLHLSIPMCPWRGTESGRAS